MQGLIEFEEVEALYFYMDKYLPRSEGKGIIPLKVEKVSEFCQSKLVLNPD